MGNCDWTGHGELGLGGTAAGWREPGPGRMEAEHRGLEHRGLEPVTEHRGLEPEHRGLEPVTEHRGLEPVMKLRGLEPRRLEPVTELRGLEPRGLEPEHRGQEPPTLTAGSGGTPTSPQEEHER